MVIKDYRIDLENFRTTVFDDYDLTNLNKKVIENITAIEKEFKNISNSEFNLIAFGSFTYWLNETEKKLKVCDDEYQTRLIRAEMNDSEPSPNDFQFHNYIAAYKVVCAYYRLMLCFVEERMF